MKKLRLFLTVVVLATLSIINVHARAVGDIITGYQPANWPSKVPDGCLYKITSIKGDSLTVNLVETTLTGDVSLPGTTVDSLGTTYKVTSVIQHAQNVKIFKNAISVTSVSFGENYLSLPAFTLISYPNITTISLPVSLERILDGAFIGCPLSDVRYAGTLE